MFLVDSKLNDETDNMKSLEWAIFVLQRKKFMKNLDIKHAQEIIGEYINKLMSDMQRITNHKLRTPTIPIPKSFLMPKLLCICYVSKPSMM